MIVDKNPLLKHMMKAKTEDVIHSSAYAQVQNQQGIGSASTESFADRMKIEKNRTRIRAYGDSKVVNDSFGQAPRPKVYNAEADKSQRMQFRDNNSAAIGRASMTNRAGATPPPKPAAPPMWKKPGISR